MLWLQLAVCYVHITPDCIVNDIKKFNNSNECENRLSASLGVSFRLSVRMEELGYRRTNFHEM